MKIYVSILLILFINIIFATVPPCGEFGVTFENDKCLCGAYTQPISGGEACASGSGVCTLPTESYVAKNQPYTLKLTAKRLNFVGDKLRVVLEFPSIVTGSTDITIFTKNGTMVSSLSDSISGTAFGFWRHRLNSNSTQCMQRVTWVVDWEELANKVQTNVPGHYAFDITATTKIRREKSDLHIRAIDLAPSFLVDVVPVTINLDQIVSTTDASDRVEFELDYDVKLLYSLKKIHVDPTTLKVRAVLQHNVSFPLSLKSKNLDVTINGVKIPAKAYEKENKVDCPALKGSSCQSKTIILFKLPFQPNCTEYQLNIDLDLSTKCGGTNDHTSKYLCYGLRKSLRSKFVHVNIPIKYNFCPKIETTEVSVRSFNLTQGSGVPLIEDEILERDTPLNGEITLNVDRIFQGSVFTMARISSIQLIESTGANPASYEISEVSTLNQGTLENSNTILISFSYAPSYQQITTHLQNWAQGFYITVTIDVSFYSPQGLAKRNSGSQPIHTSVRLQIPHQGLPTYLKRDHVLASSPQLKLNQQVVTKTIEEHKLIKQQIQTEKISQDIKVIQQSNQQMIYMIVASVAACFVALIVAVFIVYKIKKSKQQLTQI